MKVAVIALFFAASVFAQNPFTALPAACGSGSVDFNVKLDKSQHTLAQPEAGKARIYFIQEVNTDLLNSFTTGRRGIDGAWVGANKHNSWFSVTIEPGEHHLCASMWYPRLEQHVALAHLTAEPGKVYYYRLGIIETHNITDRKLDPIDSNQGKYLIASYPLSVSQSRK